METNGGFGRKHRDSAEVQRMREQVQGGKEEIAHMHGQRGVKAEVFGHCGKA